ncbi:uncharacterized protein TRUGW13939_07317 [Talaromyces rugulosus]|uniref:F-box domain-containing protein n=1 Tax=Talaromyces rugulosus TaxID=121627 RepID=A0A7H8R1E1_TALRU|nr:uncharacterized protein TRUGW13939_07317 [Talaromyces rugulosus]QKX60174.1 hypothetical protein TRUGW13939_07317 [Talaromyces rugulosus]
MGKRTTIADLPVELMLLILHHVSDTKSLLSLAFSSREIYNIYLMALKELHIGVLTRKYDETLLDINEAIAAVRSTDVGIKNNKEKAIALLDDWRRRQETATRVKGSLKVEEIKELYKFHKEILFFLADFRANLKSPYFIKDKDWNEKYVPIRLTDPERRRFVTALCRLVIHHNIFGRCKEAKEEDSTFYDNEWEQEISGVDAWRLFFGTMPPWVYHEMVCIQWHLVDRWREVLANAEIRAQMMGMSWTIRLKFRTNGYTSFGPRFLFRVIDADPSDRHNMLKLNHDRGSILPWIGFSNPIPRNLRLPLVYPADKYNVGSFDELWSKTSAADEPGTIWRRAVLKLFAKNLDFQAAFVNEDISNNPYSHFQWIGWDCQMIIWDEEKVQEWEAYYRH